MFFDRYICTLQLKLYMYIQYWYLHDTTLIQMLIKTTKVKDVLEFFIKLIYMYYKSSHF